MNKITAITVLGMPIRKVETPDGQFFVIRDICDILGLSNPNRALSRCCNNPPKYERLTTPGGKQIVRLVPPDDVRTLLKCFRGKLGQTLYSVLFGDEATVVISIENHCCRQACRRRHHVRKGE